MVLFSQLSVGDRVRTNKEWEYDPVAGKVEGFEILPDQAELDEKFSFLYITANPYVVRVRTDNGGLERLNIIWLEKLQ